MSNTASRTEHPVSAASQAQGLAISTSRLDLVAGTVEHVEAEIADAARLGALLGATVPPSWPPGEYDRGAMEYFRDKLRAGGHTVAGWYGWYAIRRAEGDAPATVIGVGGYVGPPDEHGVVEIGYSVVPERQGAGYASEMAAALVARAWSVAAVHRVVAQTMLSNVPSVGVLRRLGFVETGPGTEPGTTRFELERPRR